MNQTNKKTKLKKFTKKVNASKVAKKSTSKLKQVKKSDPISRKKNKTSSTDSGRRVTTPTKKSRNLPKKITKIEDFVYRTQVGKSSEVYLVGTAHVSKKSVELVKKTLDRYRPQVVYLELDMERKKSLTRNNYRDVDVLKIIRNNKILFFIFYLVMGFVQKKIAEKYGTRPGGEFLAALEWADTHGREVVLIDRGAETTVKRAWRSMGLWEQFRFLFSGLSPMVEEEFDVEKMQEDDVLSDMVNKLGLYFPGIKKIVIDERDEYMSYGIESHVKEAERGQKKVTERKRKVIPSKRLRSIKGLAVVGAGHLQGMRGFLESPPKDWDVHSFLRVPPAHFFWKILPWAFTGIIIAVFLVGFWYTDWKTVTDAFLVWGFITGGGSAIGTILAGGHPFTILTALITAPITTLHPILGVGLFTAIVQFYFQPPRMRDFETLTFKLDKISFWWKNRVTRILLVFILSSLGAGLGMWIALTKVIDVFS